MLELLYHQIELDTIGIGIATAIAKLSSGRQRNRIDSVAVLVEVLVDVVVLVAQRILYVVQRHNSTPDPRRATSRAFCCPW